MGAVALAAEAHACTAAELTARGAVLRVVVEGLTTPRVELSAPRGVADELRAALAWRVDAMRAAARDLRRAAGASVRAVHSVPHDRAGSCGSCGDALPGETGDCALCNAARVAALRAEGVLASPAEVVLPRRPTETEWRAELATGLDRRAPVVRTPTTWACATCGRTLTGTPDPELECGRCELRRVDVMSTANLGGRRRA